MVIGALASISVVAPLAGAEEFDPSLVDAARRLDDNVRSHESVFFEVELSRDAVYVQAELVVTRRVLYGNNVQLFNDLPKSPVIDDALVVSHGNPRQLKYFRQGIEYKALEHRFSVFADASGSITIPAIEISANVRLDDRRRPRMVRVTSPTRTIEVMPIPDSYPSNSPWLAVEALRLQDEWVPQAGAYEVGESVSRRLSVSATGVVGSTIPPLFVQTPSNLKRYDDPIELDEYVEDGVVRGTRVELQTLVPVRPGAIVTPSVEIVWWNTTTDRLATSVVPVRRFNVVGATATTPATPTAPREATAGAVPANSNEMFWMASAILGWSGCIALAALMAWRMRAKRASVAQPSIPSVARLIRDLPNEPRAARMAILKTLGNRYRWRQVVLLRRLAGIPTGRQLLTALDGSLYAREQQTFDRNEVRRLLQQAVDELDGSSAAASALPPLYPSPT